MRSFLTLIFLLSVFLPTPAHAYAGPGVAIGAIIIFFTVLFTFFASVFISIFNFFKNNIKKVMSKKGTFKKINSNKK